MTNFEKTWFGLFKEFVVSVILDTLAFAAAFMGGLIFTVIGAEDGIWYLTAGGVLMLIMSVYGTVHSIKQAWTLFRTCAGGLDYHISSN